MRLRKPDHIELEYAQQMMAWLLFIETPKRIVQLGLGAAALTKFAHRFLKRAKVEAVEVNPAVVVAARTMFELPHDDARLTVHETDAWDFVNDRANHGTIGALQIDVYDATARGPVLDSVGFYRAARACLTELRAQYEAFERSLRRPRGRAAGSARRQPHRDRVFGSGARGAVHGAASARQVDRSGTRSASAQVGQGSAGIDRTDRRLVLGLIATT
jgi:hypothetical protein